MTAKQRKRLIELYAQMATHTRPECGRCRTAYGCCDEMYCEQAIQWAKKQWGVVLKRVNGLSVHGKPLPLMGPTGCTAAPHLRPICTVHTCEIASVGCKRGDPVWTGRYFVLREAIDELEMEQAMVV